MLFQVSSIEFDFETDNGENLTKYEQASIITNTLNSIVQVDDEAEIVDAISDKTGWCIRNIQYKQVPSVEVTVYGLFCGEVNTTDKQFELPILGKKSDLAIIRAVKSALGWSGIRCSKFEYGDSVRLEPVGILQVADIEAVPDNEIV